LEKIFTVALPYHIGKPISLKKGIEKGFLINFQRSAHGSCLVFKDRSIANAAGSITNFMSGPEIASKNKQKNKKNKKTPQRNYPHPPLSVQLPDSSIACLQLI
jgi:hypothetical protein